MSNKSLDNDYSFEFSIIIPMYNVEDYIRESIDSIINQSFDFNKVQLILVDDGSVDNTKEIVIEYEKLYPDNVIVLFKENGGVATARNLGLEHATGEYIYFFDSDDKLSKDTLFTVSKLFKKYSDIDLVAIPIIFFERQEGNHPLNFRFKNQHHIVDLFENPEYLNSHAPATFLRATCVGDHKFKENLVNSGDALFINEILISKMKYALVGLEDNAIRYYRKRFNQSSILDVSATKKEFFTAKLKDYFLSLANSSIKEHGCVTKYMQNYLLYDLQFLANRPEFPSEFTEEDIKEFWDYFHNVLDYIDEEIIINHKNVGMITKYFLIYLKNNEFHIETNPKKHRVFLKSNDFIINGLHNHRISFDFVELKDGFLNFAGSFVSNCDSDFISIEAVKKGKSKEIFKASYIDYYDSNRFSPKKFLSIDWQFIYNFELSIPFEKDEISSISFRVVYNENGEKVVFKPLNAFKYYSIISDEINYFVKDSQIIVFENNMFYHLPYSYFKLFKLTLKSIKKILKKGNLSILIKYNLLYLILFPFMKNKNIWLFIDRLDKGDDNAEHLFKYAINQEDNIKKYFIIDKKSPDYDRIMKINKNVVSLGSFKHKILYLFADKIISSQITHNIFNPFFDDYGFFNNLASYQKYFLQHGVTKDDISHWIRKYYHNISLFLTSSDLERNSIVNGNYTYDESIVPVLGFPRFDNLDNKGFKKQIVIMPSWRNYFNSEKDILNSEYFSRWNNLINNSKLIEIAKNKGYEILFKPHPNLYEFVDLFDVNDYVSIDFDNKKKYQEIFNESALLITDYSSVFFDFAYLKKPLIYYHYSTDYHFDKSSYFDYETMGFGAIIETEEEMIDKIIEYLENDCNMEDEYKERVDKFFKYNDKNNSKRSYQWILEH